MIIQGTSTSAGILFQQSTGGTLGSIYGDTSGFGILDTDNNWAIRHIHDTDTAFFINANEKMRITGTGLGIGNATPPEKLTVEGNVSASGYINLDTDTSYRFRNRADLGMYETGYSLSAMAPNDIIMHIDSNANGSTQYFSVVHDQAVVGNPLTGRLFSVNESGEVFVSGSLVVVGTSTLSGNIIPSVDDTYTLGDATHR